MNLVGKLCCNSELLYHVSTTVIGCLGLPPVSPLKPFEVLHGTNEEVSTRGWWPNIPLWQMFRVLACPMVAVTEQNRHIFCSIFLLAMASNPIAMASNLRAMLHMGLSKTALLADLRHLRPAFRRKQSQRHLCVLFATHQQGGAMLPPEPREVDLVQLLCIKPHRLKV